VGPCLESGYMLGRWHAQGRTDAASLQGAATYILVAPWLAHFGGSPPTLAGALPPECICGSRRTLSFYGCFSALRPHVSHLRPGLYAYRVLYCFHGCAAYVIRVVKSSLYINNRQPYGSLSNVLRKPDLT
jgi:hypothetical protein